VNLQYLSEITINSLVRMALAEDGTDHSSLSSIPPDNTSTAQMIAKEDGVIAGVSLAERIFLLVDDKLKTKSFLLDGKKVRRKDLVMEVSGSSRSILKAERVVLNCMQRMSGIATDTRVYVDAVKGTKAKILDTRKTTPNFRLFEKWAVLIGGGTNHRYNLEDMMMLKDNHIDCAGGIKEAIESANRYRSENALDIGLEVETRNLREVIEVLDCDGVQRVMLDNMTVEEMKEAVKIIDHRIEVEASGGINLVTVKGVAMAGVDFISIGALTHSYKSLDISLVIKSQ
jgi:nicotinate-nucleotide pyrophosphorylase (carboxylating)